MNKSKYIITLMIFVVFSCKDNTSIKTHTSNKSSDNNKPVRVFEKISSDYSGLTFSNSIVENVQTLENLFNYDYFYNGAGVGVEDLNNDGLLDIFFCGNQNKNRLYINQGQLKFKDVSEEAGINQGKIWSNGITFVDINNDGWKDIYVSQGGPNTRLNRKNLLYINQKDGTFIEKAEDFGLADMGISTQTTFFDYDKDGDLDCLVMNENELYGVDPINLKILVEKNEESKYFNSSHFYLNDNGKYIDITKKAGLERPIFGLGISISDINNDGWLDIYIASDYYLPDALFINKKDGTFSDEIKNYTNHISYYGMGMDIADINNDAKQDIFVLDMASNDHVRAKTLMASMSTKRFNYLVESAGFHHQYMYNSLQLNQGNNKFSNISHLTETANTDWSWSVLISDFDHDEDNDMYITNGYRKYALDNDLQQKVYEAKLKYNNKVPVEIKKQLYNEMPSEKLSNILYQNNGDLNFKNEANHWGLDDFSFSNGAAMGDLDNDGDLELIVNNIDDECFLYKNTTIENNLGNFLRVKTEGKLSESFPKITIKYKDKVQLIESRRVRGYRSSQEPVAHFGVGKEKKIDTVIVDWPNGTSEEKYNVSTNSIIVFNEDNATFEKKDSVLKAPLFSKTNPSTYKIAFTHNENEYNDFEKEILLPYKQSTMGPFISKGDVNQDLLEDIFIGGASGQAGILYMQTPNGYIESNQTVFQNDKGYEDMESIFFDFDGDGDQDLYVVSGGNEYDENSSFYADRLYINNGVGNFSKLKSNSLEANPQSGKPVAVLDFDKDGDMDILVGNRIKPQEYPKHAPSILYENIEGELKNSTKEIAPGLTDFGIINDIIVTDFDNDGWKDFIAVGEWTQVGLFKNNQGKFSRISEKQLSLADKGWWYSINETDINNDGLPDYIVGNIGLNIKFKTSKDKPLKIYANDFDDNGTSDIVLSKKYQGEYVPVRGRECSSQQMPFIKEKFTSYNDFANAKLVDIYGEKLNAGYTQEANEFQSLLLINKGDGIFEKKYLPKEAQFFPILNCVFYDVNKDGYEDVIVAGNLYETEVETPRLDSFSGLVLISNGKDGYTPKPYDETGLYLDGNTKDIQLIRTKKEILLFATMNNGPLSIYKLNSH